MNLDKRLLRLLKFARVPLGLSVSSGILSGLFTIAQAWVLAKIINRVFLEQASLNDVADLLLQFVLFSLFRAAFNWFSQERGQLAAGILKQKLRAALTEHISRLGPLYTAGQKSGELSNTIHSGIETLNAYFSQYIPQLFFSAAIPITILIFVFPLDLLSGFVFLFTAPIIPIFMILIGQTAQSITQKQWKSLSRMSAHFLDVLQGLTTLKIFGRSKQEADNIHKISDMFRQTTMNVLKIAFLSALVLEMAATISTAVIAVEIGLRLMYAKMSFEPALFILILAPEFYQPMRQLGARFHSGMEGVTAAQRIFNILELPAGSVSHLSVPANPEQMRDICFNDVSFTYPNANAAAVSNLNFCLPAGKKTALVGSSGSGKSTIANLLLRFADTEQGAITIGKYPLNEISKGEWRRQISWLPQNPYLFHQTIAENILLARPQADKEQLINACKQANLYNFIASLPKGFDTVVGERGMRLSGGQAQRLALARVFLKDAPILILDEPASNLDPQLDKEIGQSITELSSGRTVLIIAHRLTSVQDADQIIVLERGSISEKGSHRELMGLNKRYAQLVNTYRGIGV